ncbi:PAS domain S-box protein [Pseudomonas sp. ANT_J12]|uniref:Sensory/regulatory protein RpfC n=1 Tax=Pseudomonas prosekii TaxID=1148509 RepID=A0A2U2D6R3_9PSED|nr:MULTISPECIES: CHASE domain-containing protein [Pseudomonas]KAA0982651.1 PAS domain S-box protein [Pseudomonas sp. ANT_J12]PWE43654.1 hybrid sensor histidine kinase/response regulator [Pseudomonas prosekii]
MQVRKKYKFFAWGWGVAITLVVGGGASILGSWILERINEQRATEALAVTTEDAAELVLTRLNLYQYGLRGARGAVLTAGEHGISREVFDRYIQTRDLASEFPGARAMGFVRRVAERDESVFLKQARADGKADFSIRQISPDSGERYVIQYVAPVESNQAAIGLDIASETSRREAAEYAMQSGKAQITGPITLIQAMGKPQQSFLVLMPIYRGGVTPLTAAERDAAAFGWSYAALQMEEVLKGLRIENETVHLRMRDITVPGQEVLFYESTDDSTSHESLMTHQLEREVYGRRWQIELGANPLFIQRLHQVSPKALLILGGLVTLLLAALVGVVGVSRQRRRQILAEQASLAAIVESSADGIIGKTLDGIVTNWNKGAEHLFGYTAEEAVGQTLVSLIVPEEFVAEEAHILERIKTGERITSFDTQRRRKDSQLIDVSASISPIYGEGGRVVGASKTIRDVSAKKAAEARILDLNSNLEEQVAQRTSELRQLNLLLGSVLRSATEVSIIATDLDGVIRVFNKGAEHLLGYDADELLDKHTPALLHLPEEVAARGAELTKEFAQLIEGFQVLVYKPELEGAETREWTYIRKDGSQLPITLVVTAMRDENGELSGYLGMALNITERKAAEKEQSASLERTQKQRSELMAARDHLLMAAEVAELGIWSWTLADNSLQWNDRMFEFYDLPLLLRNTGLSYEHWYSRVHPDDVVAAAGQLSAAVKGLDVYNSIFRVVRLDGQIRYIHAGAQIERDNGGVVLRVTGINRDITIQRELESRLLYAKEQADAASAAKSAFLANMSHEIRTPMNAVLGMLQLVQNTDLNGRQLDYVTKAQTAAKSLLGLLNDILDYSKIEAGKLQLDVHPFELEPLMRDLAVVLAGNQGQKEVEVMFDLDSNLPNDLIGDSLRLQQVLINLAGNALKFTMEGQIVVSVEQLLRTESSVSVRIAVSDTGIGISPEQLQRIFEGFTQAEASTTRRFGGTGLGLVICKRLVNLMGGELQVESKQGAGSRFWFDITLDVAKTSLLRSVCPKVDVSMRILIVDDNAMAGELLLRTVHAMGWKADHVSDGTLAVESVKKARARGEAYDVVLMDWRMSDMDGLSAAQLIQQQGNGMPPPKVIMITAYGREVLADAHQMGDAPFVGFLTKPVTPKQLADAVLRAFDGKGLLQSSPSRSAVDRPRRLAGLRLLVVEDNMLNRQVADELLAGEGAEVMLAEGGLEGVSRVLAESVPFDAVLMDIQMPDIDGFEATRRIRSNSRFAALPIVAMTANASNTDREACLAAGMNAHVGKPINLEQLVATLLFQTGREENQASPFLRQGNTAEGVIESRASIIDRFGGDLDLIRNVLRNFGPESEKQLIRLRDQIQRHDAPGAAFVLHSIKGSSGTMGASALSLLAGNLEHALNHGGAESVASTFADSIWIDQLSVLLQQSLEQMNLEFGQSPRENISTGEDSIAPAHWRECMEEILLLLEAGNLQAIELADALASKTPQSLRPQFDELVAMVQSLDFSAAMPIGRELLRYA